MSGKNLNKSMKIILDELNRFKKDDYSFKSGRILGSMCTEPLPLAKDAYNIFFETNLGDPGLFPGSKEIEKSFISFVKKLLNAPKGSDGLIISGGTEGNITSMWLAKVLTGKKKIVVPEHAHFSFKKIASLMDMEVVSIPLTDSYVMDVEKFIDVVDSDTAVVVGVAGSTELGTIDPIPDLSRICIREDIFLHVDAAFGGYVIPFLKMLGYDVWDFDFKLNGVMSVSLDSHKMGCSAIPLGTIVFREGKWLDDISVESTCISSITQSGIAGTRSGGPVAAGYAVSKFLGMEGYKNIVKDCMDNTIYTRDRIKEIGLELAVEPTMNVLGVKIKNLDRMYNELVKMGWRIGRIDRLSCIRLVIMPHVKKTTIDSFIPVLEKVCKKVGEI